MEPVLQRRGFENLGLQLLFAPIRLLVGAGVPAVVSDQKKRTLLDFGKFLQEAGVGLDLVERRGEGYGALTPSQSVKRERAYRSISQFVPKDPDAAKEFLAQLNRIRQQLLDGHQLTPPDRDALYSFCCGVLARLDQERAELFEGAEEEVWA